MLDLDSWLPQAQALPVGGKSRVAHDCGDGTPMIVNHKVDGYSAYCFRCGEPGYQSKEPSLAELVEARRQREAGDRSVISSVAPPGPPNQDPQTWPKEARLWLYRAGIGNHEIAQLGFYYHEKSGRVVLPVVNDGRVVYWQARAVRKDHQPKYLNPDVDKTRVLPRYGTAEFIVLTEDILSAAKVGLVAEGWSMLGTKLHGSMLSALIEAGKPVIVWLDPDAAGKRGAAKTLRTLRSVGIQCCNLVSERDPKLHSRKEISELTEPLIAKLRRASSEFD